jgi:hypothetical protein
MVCVSKFTSHLFQDEAACDVFPDQSALSSNLIGPGAAPTKFLSCASAGVECLCTYFVGRNFDGSSV